MLDVLDEGYRVMTAHTAREVEAMA
ncbi:hypothetical protein THICB1_130055 [Thiomonas arsenitoxydans]|uniref:Uncharacterized protein n=1 Tax=Thiomonas arsenitoxydans (strain DSM 22701 / CIP 110005 / 3As) TaxID=426114 RepID=A0ABP1Z2M8_THIA3|nr:hypothetical protein ACO7_110014 [Thiomonas arsenitoxydans]CQR28693.1 hypothetical protein ACO3_120014 [Thiomonas arsenitoxydans]CQR28966.1 hypothetical protein THICB6_140055 [Thiomonas arsenitoxydans]CQR30012.1 hypothetical protein THICB1_130055 [Thiomonas arsenitoxydans]